LNSLKIGLTGKARSGKDTVANYLVERHQFKRVAFGDSLKRFLSEIFPDLINENKPRALLQRFGQSMREFDEDVWIKHALNKANGSKIVITDVRQPNEYLRLKDLGYVIIRVESTTQNRFNRMMTLGDVFNENDMRDETETALDSYDVDFTIVNDGDLSMLSEQVDFVLTELLKRHSPPSGASYPSS
jgi:dephospho-CoA kinase